MVQRDKIITELRALVLVSRHGTARDKIASRRSKGSINETSRNISHRNLAAAPSVQAEGSDSSRSHSKEKVWQDTQFARQADGGRVRDEEKNSRRWTERVGKKCSIQYETRRFLAPQQSVRGKKAKKRIAVGLDTLCSKWRA